MCGLHDQGKVNKTWPGSVLISVLFLAWQWWRTPLNLVLRRQRHVIFEVKASLVYRESSRTARATQGIPVWKPTWSHFLPGLCALFLMSGTSPALPHTTLQQNNCATGCLVASWLRSLRWQQGWRPSPRLLLPHPGEAPNSQQMLCRERYRSVNSYGFDPGKEKGQPHNHTRYREQRYAGSSSDEYVWCHSRLVKCKINPP